MAKRPFLDWLYAVDPTSHNLSLADLNDDPSIYLLPDPKVDGAAKRQIRKFCREIFEHELDGWWRERSAWPQDLSYGKFVSWFDCRYYSMVVDVADMMLTR